MILSVNISTMFNQSQANNCMALRCCTMKRRDLFLKNKLDRSMDFVRINILAQISEPRHEKNNILAVCYEKT